jgi:hypothetical protein
MTASPIPIRFAHFNAAAVRGERARGRVAPLDAPGVFPTGDALGVRKFGRRLCPVLLIFSRCNERTPRQMPR